MDFKLDKVVFDTMEDAMKVLESMDQIVKKYKTVTVADFFELANVKTMDCRSKNYGWRGKDIFNAKVTATDKFDGFNITFPRPFELFPHLESVEITTKEPDMVNRPPHYCTGKFECIDVMTEIFGAEAVQNFCLCNAFKYLYRTNRKNGIEDINKAQWYLNKYVELEGEKK